MTPNVTEAPGPAPTLSTRTSRGAKDANGVGVGCPAVGVDAADTFTLTSVRDVPAGEPCGDAARAPATAVMCCCTDRKEAGSSM
jgi:hypothetical protein